MLKDQNPTELIIMTAPTPERARALLELVEEFLLKPRRGSRAQSEAAKRRNMLRAVGPRTRCAPASMEIDFDFKWTTSPVAGREVIESPEEMRAWREALKGPK